MRRLWTIAVSGLSRGIGKDIFTIVPVFEADLLGADDSCADENSDNEKDGNADNLDSNTVSAWCRYHTICLK